MANSLVTFGCSWTYGIGANYISEDIDIYTELRKQHYNKLKGADWPLFSEYEQGCHLNLEIRSEIQRVFESSVQYPSNISETVSKDETLCYKYSFRGLLTKKLGIENQNFSAGGSSNDMQFDSFFKIFGNEKLRNKFINSNPIVLWGITSTARLYRNGKTVFLPRDYNAETEEEKYASLHLKLYYDHNEIVSGLGNTIEMVNIVLEHYKIPILWFDTFNTHKYPNKPRNFFSGGDILTQMLRYAGVKYKRGLFYHRSDWGVDDPRVDAGIQAGLLNPYTKHPTQKGHEIIQDILFPSLELLNKTYNN